MKSIHDEIDAALSEAVAALTRVRKIHARQIRGVDELAMLKATAQLWFHTRKPRILGGSPSLDLSPVDRAYSVVIEATARSAAKTTYFSALQDAKAALVQARSEFLSIPSDVPDETVPDFTPLAGNAAMREILSRRWLECSKCVRAEAHMAAIVMMGGLLEALFVARANQLVDKAPLFNAKNAPKERATGRPSNYQVWMLDTYIKVGCELKWITESAKEVADRIKEYRNFVHPAKELRYGITLGANDSAIFWQVTKAIARQLLQGAI